MQRDAAKTSGSSREAVQVDIYVHGEGKGLNLDGTWAPGHALSWVPSAHSLTRILLLFYR